MVDNLLKKGLTRYTTKKEYRAIIDLIKKSETLTSTGKALPIQLLFHVPM